MLPLEAKNTSTNFLLREIKIKIMLVLGASGMGGADIGDNNTDEENGAAGTTNEVGEVVASDNNIDERNSAAGTIGAAGAVSAASSGGVTSVSDALDTIDATAVAAGAYKTSGAGVGDGQDADAASGDNACIKICYF